MNKSYSELIKFTTFEERYNYLKMEGVVGEDTFGSRRYLNQSFYRSKEWRNIRDKIIVRDNGMDLGIKDVGSTILYIHHINPITIYDIENKSSKLMDPENLISVTKKTHDAIHYGEAIKTEKFVLSRSPYDTCPWKKQEVDL